MPAAAAVRVLHVHPDLPPHIHRLALSVLQAPDSSADTLLILADALVEVSYHVFAWNMGAALRCLAQELCARAPEYA